MQCLKCGHEQPDATAVCPRCGAVHAKLKALAGQGAAIRQAYVPTPEEEAANAELRRRMSDPVVARQVAVEQARASGDWSGLPAELRNAEAARVVVVTTAEVPGCSVEAVLGIAAGEYAYAFGAIGEELGGMVRNLVGAPAALLEHGGQVGGEQLIEGSGGHCRTLRDVPRNGLRDTSAKFCDTGLVEHDLDVQVRQLLEANRGRWQRIAADAKVSHSWISQFVRNKIPNPGYATLKSIYALLGPRLAVADGERVVGAAAAPGAEEHVGAHG